MIVEVTKESGDRFPRQGEVYKAQPYQYDSDKVTLMYQVDPVTHMKLEKQYTDQIPMCNEYRDNIEILEPSGV